MTVESTSKHTASQMRQIAEALAFLEEEEEEPIVDSSAVALVELFELLLRCF